MYNHPERCSLGTVRDHVYLLGKALLEPVRYEGAYLSILSRIFLATLTLSLSLSVGCWFCVCVVRFVRLSLIHVG